MESYSFVSRICGVYIHVSATSEFSPIWAILIYGHDIDDPIYTLIALTLYDTLLTIDREVNKIWTRGHATTTVIYIVARYSSILNHLALLFGVTRWRGQNIQVRFWLICDPDRAPVPRQMCVQAPQGFAF